MSLTKQRTEIRHFARFAREIAEQRAIRNDRLNRREILGFAMAFVL